MAELVDLNKKDKIILKLNNYENRNEYWFSSQIRIISNNMDVKGESPLHLNDLVGLLDNLRLFIKHKKSNFYVFEPMEPYLSMIFKLINNQYIIDIFFCEGPIFEINNYKYFTIETAEDSINFFVNQIENEIKNIDPKLELKKVNF